MQGVITSEDLHKDATLIVEDPKLDSHFHVGLRVLAVDNSQDCLRVLTTLLEKCCYKATATTNTTTALEMLQQDPKSFDIIIMDIHMEDMDGFTFLDTIRAADIDIPVILVSDCDDVATVTKSVRFGACKFMVKPLGIQEIRNIWQHVYKKKISQQPAAYSRNDHDQQNYKEESISHKKMRIKWKEDDLHEKFEEAVNHLGGLESAQPKEILRFMNKPDLSRESVASHLQKCRERNKRRRRRQQQQHDSKEPISSTSAAAAGGGMVTNSNAMLNNNNNIPLLLPHVQLMGINPAEAVPLENYMPNYMYSPSQYVP
ncbi:hypothetical protein Dimus_021486 [Dionaea muscipula]